METILELVNKARSGDIQSQKILLENCQSISSPLAYKYLRSAVALGLTLDDLRQLVYVSFINALNNYDPDRQSFYNYYKYVYLMAVKQEIRKAYSEYEKEANFVNIEDIDSAYDLQFQSPMYEEESSPNIEYSKQEIIDIIVNQKKIKLTKKELDLIKLFFQDYTIKEMATMLNRNYSETCKSLKRAINKIKKYFENE